MEVKGTVHVIGELKTISANYEKRRYGLQSFCAVGSEDDDGQKAVAPKPAATAKYSLTAEQAKNY